MYTGRHTTTRIYKKRKTFHLSMALVVCAKKYFLLAFNDIYFWAAKKIMTGRIVAIYLMYYVGRSINMHPKILWYLNDDDYHTFHVMWMMMKYISDLRRKYQIYSEK